MFKLNYNQTAKHQYAKKEKTVSDFIPYKCHWNENTILTKANGLLQIIKLDGFSFETADDSDLDIRNNMRNSLLKNMASGNVTLYFHIIRRNKPVIDLSERYSIDPTVTSSGKFIDHVENTWIKKNSDSNSYFNELYISILYEADKEGAAVFQHLMKKLQQSTAKSAWKDEMTEMYENLQEMSTRVLNTFRDYDARLLEVVETPEGTLCEMSSFLARLVNCGEVTNTILPKKNLDEHIANTRLFFGYKSIEARSAKSNKFAGVVSVREYCPSTIAGMFDGFLRMPFEFIISQSFVFSNRTVIIQKMQMQQNRMIQAEDKAVSQVAQISQALDMATGGEIGFGQHHISVLCMDKDLKALENTLSMAAVELSNCGMQPVRETINMEPSYWGQLPGNISYIARQSIVNTLNLAAFASMHNYPLGKETGNHWGDHVTILDTTSGTPFYFNFHVRDVGHSLIIGPTGAGKTVLMNFLCAQAQKFHPRSFFFDKDRGAEIFIRAMDGVYAVIDPGAGCGFNPLQLKNTGENRTFLLDWLKALVTSNGESVTSEDIKLLNQAIEGNYRLDKKDRRLSNIVPFLGMDTTGSLASRISMWHGEGSHAKVFDNEVDSIDLDNSRVFGFEMAELLKDKYSLAPALLYIFHRINISLDGSNTMIVLDEAWALIDNPVFAPKIKDWLKVLRKLNTFVIFATQSVEDAAKSQISDTLIQQTATQIFLPNLKATEVYKSAFMLSEREFVLIKTTNPSSRYFLVKQGINAVVAKLNLSGMEDIISVLSGSASTTVLLNEIRAQYGDDPDQWLPVFYKEVKQL